MSAVLDLPPARADFARYRDTLRARLDAELAGWIPALFEDSPDARRARILGALEAGKRLRGAMTCLACEALGGRRDAAIPCAVAIECIHAASLIHDDFVDDDHVRRDRAALWTIDGAREAVLAADVLFATAIDRVVSADPDAGAIVARAIGAMATGAFGEFRDGMSYERIVALKTGALFAAAASLGALAADADPPARERAREFGEHVGFAYQVADDLADLLALGDAEAPAPLACAVRYFRPSETVEARPPGSGAAPAATDRSRATGLVAVQMRAAIARRLERARRSLAGFPENRYTRMLLGLADAAVAAQVVSG